MPRKKKWFTSGSSIVGHSLNNWQNFGQVLYLLKMLKISKTQRSFAKLALKQEYKDSETALIKLKLKTLEQRRKELCLKFSIDSIKHKTLNDLFPINEQTRETRNKEKKNIKHYKRTLPDYKTQP